MDNIDTDFEIEVDSSRKGSDQYELNNLALQAPGNKHSPCLF